eukprot:CAMPEP_0171227438 /NCGR_PEP_ID=MMETSP0790-20130122/37843_1 /TAXON_ID=2925 /ORGANISM="Alexandrium catenella, Strain OF101" /LENGTH=178 /DNA_ID=CAMNT_0011693543 /DNA_START=86 /DNA_END=622 /DNA_ORIENTATION=-
MPAQPVYTGFTNKDIVAAMKALQSTHAGNSGYYMMVEQHPAEAFGHLAELATHQGYYGNEDAELEPEAAKGSRAWASEPPRDLSDLPLPKRETPQRTEEVELEQEPIEEEQQQQPPLRAWSSLVVQERDAVMSKYLQDQSRAECNHCASKGSKTLVRDGAACWLCGHRSGEAVPFITS